MTNATPSNHRSNYNHGLPNAQIPAITEIWRDACALVRDGIRCGYRDPQVLGRVAATAAHNHPRRWELPGDPAGQFLVAHQLGFEVVRHVLDREVWA